MNGENVPAKSNDETMTPVTMLPAVDIMDGNDGVTIWFEVPGANSGTSEVEVKDRILTVKASSSLKRNGRPVLFKRTFQLTDGADVEKISAKSCDGVLTLTIPKSDRAKVHRIKVS
jgi:HSP20 family molecular chaperone IbpA